MASGWLIALGLLNLYVLFLFWLVRTGRMEKWNLSLLLGFILMIRTQRGRALLDKIATPKRFWNVFGDAGIVVTLVGMVVMTLYLFAALFIQLRTQTGGVALGANEILIIPGVTPWLPLGYGILALIVTLVVHEGGHGVLARANNLKVKSLGLLFAIVPVGAFVEPDEDELKAASRRNRLRVFAAGVMVNLVVAGFLLAGFAGMVNAMEPIDGVGIQRVTVGMPAEAAGIRPGDILTAANGEAIQDWQAFTVYMDGRSPGQEILFDRHEDESVFVTLTSRWQSLGDDQRLAIMQDFEGEQAQAICNALVEPDPETSGQCRAALEQDAFVGVGPYLSGTIQDTLGHPFSQPTGLLFYMGVPLSEVIIGEPILGVLPTFFETPWDGTAMEWAWFPIAFTLFWIFWINLMVGLTNILPMLPLDGGHIFRDAIGGILQRIRPSMSHESVEKTVGSMAGGFSILMLAAVVLTFVLPHIF